MTSIYFSRASWTLLHMYLNLLFTSAVKQFCTFFDCHQPVATSGSSGISTGLPGANARRRAHPKPLEVATSVLDALVDCVALAAGSHSQNGDRTMDRRIDGPESRWIIFARRTQLNNCYNLPETIGRIKAKAAHLRERDFCINDEAIHHPHCSHYCSPNRHSLGSLPLEPGSFEDHVEGLAGALPRRGYPEREASLHSH